MTAHHGASSALDSRVGRAVFWQEVLRTLAENGHAPNSPKRLFVAGHSLGGGMATLATHRLLFSGCWDSLVRGNISADRKVRWQDSTASLAEQHPDDKQCLRTFIPVTALYTFGQLRVGDSLFAKTLTARARELGTGIYRVVNSDDFVPKLPPKPIYAHVGVNDDEDSLRISLASDGRVVEGAIAAGPSGQSCGGLSDHRIRSYVDKLRAATDALASNQPLRWTSECAETDPNDPLLPVSQLTKE